MTRIMGTLHEDQYMFLIICHSFLVRMKNVSDRSRRENWNTYFIIHKFFFENRAVYEIMWKNIVEAIRPHTTIWHTRITCWIPKLQIHTQNM